MVKVDLKRLLNIASGYGLDDVVVLCCLCYDVEVIYRDWLESEVDFRERVLKIIEKSTISSEQNC